MQAIATGSIATLFILLFLVEKRWPLRPLRHPWLHRIFVNLILSVPMLIVASLLIGPASLKTIEWAGQHQFGVSHWIYLPVPLEFILEFLLLDLSFYYWHWLNHNIPILWRFHNVHHIDPDLDVTTSLRFHYGEVLYSVMFRFLQLGLLGVSPITYLIYEIAFQTNTFFQHSNVRLPFWLERLLVKMIVTPRMHGIHHSQIPTELNSNYSTVFSFWDRLHKTLQLNIPQDKVIIGVPGYSNPEDNQVLNLLILPFKKQQDYWLLPSGIIPKREKQSAFEKELME